MPTLLIFGDSDTHGTRPIVDGGDYRHLDAKAKWRCITKEALRDKWLLIEQGLPDRTTCFDVSIMGSFINVWVGLKIALFSHGNNLLKIILRTNDCKTLFGNSVRDILGGVSGLWAIAQNASFQGPY
jgi:hypothetical protein